LLALFVFLQPGSSDPRLGAWTLVSAQSTLTPPNQLSITDSHDGVHVVMSGETHLDFTAKAGAHDTPVPGNPAFNQVDLHHVNKRQAEVTEKKDGALVATVGEKLSKDGSELTVTTAVSGRPDQITVWARSGGAKVTSDPLAGDWTEDLSKTRLRQGLVLKFEPNGDNGVRFTGDYSYTARFDGKPYDLQNSRNDTVSLQLANARTVNATYRRDNQVTQHDKWTVSADGHQMTLTSTATLDTGQHLAENLVFNKQ
jgi:hypothetical protein